MPLKLPHGCVVEPRPILAPKSGARAALLGSPHAQLFSVRIGGVFLSQLAGRRRRRFSVVLHREKDVEKTTRPSGERLMEN